MEEGSQFFSNQTNAIIGYVVLGFLIFLIFVLLTLFLIYYYKNAKRSKEVKQVILPNGLVIVDDSEEIYKKEKQKKREERRKEIEEIKRKQNRNISKYNKDLNKIKASSVTSVCYYEYPECNCTNGWSTKADPSNYTETYALEPYYKNNRY